MAVSTSPRDIEWPQWANLALAATVLTSILTVYATLNDIW
jgi:hypothetical protein